MNKYIDNVNFRFPAQCRILRGRKLFTETLERGILWLEIRLTLSRYHQLTFNLTNDLQLSNFSLAERLGDSDHIMTSNTVFPYKWTAPEAFVTTGAYVNEEHQVY